VFLNLEFKISLPKKKRVNEKPKPKEKKRRTQRNTKHLLPKSTNGGARIIVVLHALEYTSKDKRGQDGGDP